MRQLPHLAWTDILESEVPQDNPTNTRTFVASVEASPRGGIAVRIPFDPSVEWGAKERHDVTGSVADRKVRGRLAVRDGGHYLELGPAWFRDNPVAHGAEVSVTLAPEGPQVVTMSADLAQAFIADPDARRYFESLATFYRKAFVRWIEGAKRPDTRARRIAETITALKAGRRQI